MALTHMKLEITVMQKLYSKSLNENESNNNEKEDATFAVAQQWEIIIKGFVVVPSNEK